jgi:predicted RNase H-like HicB family nuclease
MEIRDILRRPYQRVLIPDAESGTFTAMIGEFPGCVAQGETAAEAYEILETTAESWLEGAIEAGLSIPEPGLDYEYSGRVVLRMPRSTHRRAAEAAQRDGVSLNAYLVAAVSERLGLELGKRKVTV